jgi:uncharacterized RDD family membrane protein YckC
MFVALDLLQTSREAPVLTSRRFAVTISSSLGASSEDPLMYCSACGAALAEGAAFCSVCGKPTGVPSAIQPDLATSTEAALPSAWGSAPVPAMAAKPQQVHYAGFWLRLVALIIDDIILQFVVGIPLVGMIGAERIRDLSGLTDPSELAAAMLPTLFLLIVVTLAGSWLYFALLESSSWQATPGKKALGLYVTDLEGRRISFGRASIRYFGKIISGLTLGIGYVMAGFTERKQALHDIIAGCLVLRKM